MAETELETTLRIRPQIDEQAAAQIGDQIAAQVNRKLGAGIGAGGGGGGSVGPSTVSTASAGAGVPGAGTVSTGSGVAPGAPGASTTSTAGPPGGGGGGGAGNPPGGRSPSTGDSGGGGGAGPVQRIAPTDYSRYMSGGIFGGDARMLAGVLQDRPLQTAVAMSTSAFGTAALQAARGRADQIDAMRQSGVPESQLPGMGLLRYAGPIGAAATAIGGFAVNQIDKGLSLQEQTSARYAGWAPTLAAALQGGIIGTGYSMRESSAARYGALDADAQVRAMQSMLGIGVRQDPSQFLPTLRMGMTGASLDAITGYQQARQFGNNTTTLANAAGAIGAGQAYGLTGPGLDSLLGQIAQNTRSMAMRGVRVDAADINALLNRAVGAGISPGVAMQGIQNSQDRVGALINNAEAPYAAWGDALIEMQALRGARSDEERIRNLRAIRASPSRIMDTLRGAPALVSASHQGTGFENDLTRAPPSPFETTGRAPQFLDTDGPQAAGVRRAMSYAASRAATDTARVTNLQSPEAYEGQQRMKESLERGAMEFDFINKFKAGLMDAIQNGFSLSTKGLEEAINRLNYNLESRP